MATRTGSIAIALQAQATGTANEQWVHLLPKGSFHGRDGRGPWSVRNAEAVIQATQARAGKTQIPIDYDHQSDFAARPGVGGTAPAAGWIKGLQVRADGVWGLAEWTRAALAKLAAREYRYISPVFAFDKETGEVRSIHRAGLTNSPNLDLNAVAAAGDQMDDELTEIRSELGLPLDASLSDIINAIRQLMTTTTQSGAPDPAAYVPIGAFERVTAELNKVNQGVSVQAAEIAVNQQIERGRLPPFLKGWAVELCSVNKPAFDAFVERTGKNVSRLFREQVPGSLPDFAAGGQLTPDEQAVCTALKLTPAEFHGKTKKV